LSSSQRQKETRVIVKIEPTKVSLDALFKEGTPLQLCLSFSLHRLGTPAVFAQAIAIALATACNFAFHHLFTSCGAAHKR
jgi:hypothetical protein